MDVVIQKTPNCQHPVDDYLHLQCVCAACFGPKIRQSILKDLSCVYYRGSMWPIFTMLTSFPSLTEVKSGETVWCRFPVLWRTSCVWFGELSRFNGSAQYRKRHLRFGIRKHSVGLLCSCRCLGAHRFYWFQTKILSGPIKLNFVTDFVTKIFNGLFDKVPRIRSYDRDPQLKHLTGLLRRHNSFRVFIKRHVLFFFFMPSEEVINLFMLSVPSARLSH